VSTATKQDLESIHDHIAEFDSLAHADHVLDRLMKVVEGLAQFPERASYPKEIVALGIKEYRQTALEPNRVIYRVVGSRVVNCLIVDGRRDMQSVLARRLLGA
jgi:toxin ParE1/3/4